MSIAKINLPPVAKGFKTEVMDLTSIGRPKMPSKEDLHNIEMLNDSHLLTPSFFVFSHDEMTQYKIPESQQLFKIGRSQKCDITLDDHGISSEQVSVVRLGDTCYFMDCGAHDCVYFNGINERQAFIPSEGRMVMRIGHTWVVYIGIDAHNYADLGDSMLVKKALTASEEIEKNVEGEIVIDSLFGEWLTHSSPILIGSHISCDYKIYGSSVKAFHALIYFTPQGAFVEDLTHGFPGLTIDNVKTIGGCPIDKNMEIKIDETPINLKIYGDLHLRCDCLFFGLETKPNLALTQLKAANGNTFPLKHGNYTVGRGHDCDIIINDSSVSKHHATLFSENKYLKMTDTGSKNRCYVNTNEVKKASVHPGDIIEFGDAFFLLHYQ
jgi:hypothetical protein